MDLTPSEERSLLKHPVEALLAVALLVSLLFIAPDRQSDSSAQSCAPAAAACQTP
jgi:hypothetical protein